MNACTCIHAYVCMCIEYILELLVVLWVDKNNNCHLALIGTQRASHLAIWRSGSTKQACWSIKGVSKGVSEVSGNWSDFFILKILI